jgi:hypothetical protein
MAKGQELDASCGLPQEGRLIIKESLKITACMGEGHSPTVTEASTKVLLKTTNATGSGNSSGRTDRTLLEIGKTGKSMEMES